ncbi:hypothetical protein GCM10010145_51390 [Streptomyces ruber]|uniref:STAS domain-containing protein n=2 Tax=Streptomyces TaxID=1883 RepID=A0A918BLP8_9ACTN|nr:STAS domain-containing protein [Streptomyces ruber]GGQ75507.1 hypothetical protein GCM10010145_51390 [Streptomyces ruber]
MGVCSRLVIHDIPVAEGRIARLRLFGELDRDTVQDLCDRVVDVVVGGGRSSVVLDVSSITWCDNASLFTLLGIHSALQCTGGGLTLVSVGSPVGRALDRTGLHRRLSVDSRGHSRPLRPGPPRPGAFPIPGLPADEDGTSPVGGGDAVP